MVIHLSSHTVQPSVFSATGLLRLQACTVPVWSVKSTSRSKPVVAEKAWSPPGQNWLVQLCMSSVTWNLHLELRQGKKTDWGIVNQTNVFNLACSKDWSKTPGLWGPWPFHESSLCTCMNSPAALDDFWNRRVEVELGDEAVCDAKESLRVVLGLLLQLAHCVHVSDGIHCTDKDGATNSRLQSFFLSVENRLHMSPCHLISWCVIVVIYYLFLLSTNPMKRPKGTVYQYLPTSTSSTKNKWFNRRCKTLKTHKHVVWLKFKKSSKFLKTYGYCSS